jgi:hypothetical protein
LSIVYQLCTHRNVTATVIRMDTSDGGRSTSIISGVKERFGLGAASTSQDEEVLQAHVAAMDASPGNTVSSQVHSE